MEENGKRASVLRLSAVMTAFSLLCKLLGVFLRLYISARIGSEGMGLYQLVMSVYGMFATFATAGFTVSVSRLAAEKSLRSPADSVSVLRNSYFLALAVSAVSALVMFFCSDMIASRFLGDVRVSSCLRILALSMPFMSLSACLKGWFISKRKVVITSSASLFEEIVKMAVIGVCIGVFMAGTNDIGVLCIGIVIGITCSETASFAYLFLFRAHESRRADKSRSASESPRSVRRTVASVTAPIAAGVYISSFLHTAETLLIPFVLAGYSGDRFSALAQFGKIKGMVIPILFFPFAFLGSLVSVFTPEISRLNLQPDRRPLAARIKSIMNVVSAVSVAVGGMFFFLPSVIGDAFYPGEGTGNAIMILSLVTPFMYAETVADGLLKAVGEQVKTLKYTIYNTVLRVVLIFTLVAARGEEGYLLLLVVSNTFAYFLCRTRLFRVTGVKPAFCGDILAPLACACVSGVSARAVVARLPYAGRVAPAACGIAVYIGIFALCMLLTSAKRVSRAARAFVGGRI